MTFYRRNPAMTFYLDGAMYLEQPSSKTFLKLEETGRRIWELLEYPISIDEIAQKLVCEFSGSPEDISRDTACFIESLVDKDRITQQSIPLSPEDTQRFRYLRLLKRSLVNLTYPEHELRIRLLGKHQGQMAKLERERYLRDIRYREEKLYNDVIDRKHDQGFSSQLPFTFSHTMTGLPALDNIERCAEIVFAENIPGDFLEAGVCHGGATIFMRALQVCYGQQNRRTWVADSFEGLPKPKARPDVDAGLDLSEPVHPWLAFPLEAVKDHFLRYDLLDAGVEFLPGWFSETLPKAPVERLALLRIDADLYSSTREVLKHLYPRLVQGGFVIVDDYGALEVCRRAVDEYREKHAIADPIYRVNRHVVYWRKEG